MNEENSLIPVRGVVPIAEMTGGDKEYDELLRVMGAGAENYLRCFPWCKDIRKIYFGDGYGGIVAVFLFLIEPSRSGVDEWLWVVFGDVPPAYLVTDECKSPSEVLEAYIQEVARWVSLAKQGRSSKDVIPVYMPATPENSADVGRRLKILSEVVVPAFRQKESGQH